MSRFFPRRSHRSPAPGTDVVLQATNDIFLRSDSPITATGGAAGALTLQAGRSITLNSSITTSNGDLVLLANDPTLNADPLNLAKRDAGPGSILQHFGTSIQAGTGDVTMRVGATAPGAEAGTISLPRCPPAASIWPDPRSGLSGATLSTPAGARSIRLDADSLTLAPAGWMPPPPWVMVA